MTQITREAPRKVKWLSWLLVTVGGAGVVAVVGALFQWSYAAANLPELRAMGAYPPVASGIARTATLFAVLGLLGVPVAWLVRIAHRRARLAAAAFGLVMVVCQAFLQQENVNKSLYSGTLSQDTVMLINSLSTSPVFIWLLSLAQVAILFCGIACVVLCFHPDTVEFLRIRREPAADEQWDRALANRREAVELKRD